MNISIGSRQIGPACPTYFIADIAANHDGSLDRACRLIALAKDAGADAAKFQHFRAASIVSEYGFSRLGRQMSHQAAWTKSVVEVYSEAALPEEWTPNLRAECDRVGITFFSSPYHPGAVDALAPHVPAFKIGSGEIDWIEAIRHIATQGKPVLLATGASTITDVARAVDAILAVNPRLVLMQCNTNYTAAGDNFDHLNLNVLKTYAARWPGVVLGLSDHTQGNVAVLGAVALGARVIERHFTDDNGREGPDHRFALSADAWQSMVKDVRTLERALGSTEKFVAGNERETAIVQRRCVRAARALRAGTTIARSDVAVLRPATPGAITPAELEAVVGRIIRRDVVAGEDLRWSDFG